MAGAVLPPCLAWGQYCWPTPKLLAWDSRTFRANLAWCLVGTLLLSPGSWCTQGFACALQESVSPVLWRFCNQIPLASMSPGVHKCRSPTPAARDSSWRDERCQRMRQPLIFLWTAVYSKFKILFYTFTKALGQRFDIFSSPSSRFIISINHCCSSNRVPASVILLESTLSSIIYLF